MTQYNHRGVKADWESYQTSYEHVAKVSKKGSDLRAKTTEVEKAIEKGQEDFDIADREVMKLKKQLANAEANRKSVEERNANHRKTRAETIELTEQVSNEFEEAKNRRNKAKEVYLQSIPTAARKPIEAPKIMGPSSGFLDIFTLGDVHGWAPGLANYMVEHNLAEVTVNGIPYVKNADKIFPDVDELAVKGRPMEGQWIDGNPFTPFHMKDRHENYRGAFGDVEVHPGKNLDNGFFLQVGDLNDRGDYSELNFDIMRQLALTSGGRALALLGNHEEMLLTGNYQNWLKNEDQSGFYDSKTSPGSVRLKHEFLGIKGDAVEEYRQSLFFSYCAHFAHLLLTQEYVLRNMLDEESRARYAKLTEPALKMGNITEEKLKEIAVGRSWSVLELCQKWLQNIWKSEKELIIPGGIVLFSVGNMLGLHASVNSLKKFFDSKRSENFLKPYTTKSGSIVRLHMYTSIPKIRSPDSEMLWERDNKGWTSGKASKKMVETATSLQKKIPHIASYVQGHEPLSGKEMRVKTHSIPTAFGNVSITNLDIGMTPVYLPAKMEDKYSHTRIPDGLKILTFGKDPVRIDKDFTTSHGLTVVPCYESRLEPYRVKILDSSKKHLIEISKNPKGKLVMKCTEHGYLMAVEQDGKFVDGSKVVFEATKPASARCYRVARGFLGAKKITLIGDVMFRTATSIRSENDRVLLQAKRDEEEAQRKAEEQAQRKAEEEAQKKAEARRRRKAAEEAASKKKAEEKAAAEKAEQEAAAEKEREKPVKEEPKQAEKRVEQAPTLRPPTAPPGTQPAKPTTPPGTQPAKTVTPQEAQPAKPATPPEAQPAPATNPAEHSQDVVSTTTLNTELNANHITIFLDAPGPKMIPALLKIFRNISGDKIRFVIHGTRQPNQSKKYPDRTKFEPNLQKYQRTVLTSSGCMIHLTEKPFEARANYSHLFVEKGARKPPRKLEKELIDLIKKLEEVK